MPVAKTINLQKAETEIAVLKFQVNNIEEKVGEIKSDIKDLHGIIESHAEENKKMLKDIQNSSSSAHKSMSDKISSLEKWRWMLMGAGVVLGSLGFNTISSLLK